MTALLGKAGKKLFEKHLEQYSPVDPQYEMYVDARGKQKRRKRQLPPGLSARDAKILKSIKKRAHRLDKGVSLCGFRVGWTFFIGLVPGAGDVVDASLNYFLVVRKARQADLPPWLIRQMLFNNAVSAGVGLVPFVGDVILGVYKANSRNAALLEEFLRIRGEEFLRLQAEGKDVTVVQAQGKDVSVVHKGGKKSKTVVKKNGVEEVASGVAQNDVEQVHPGAGREGDEVIPGSRRKGSLMAWMGGNKTTNDKGKERVAAPVGERGRFVENVGESSTKK